MSVFLFIKIETRESIFYSSEGDNCLGKHIQSRETQQRQEYARISRKKERNNDRRTVKSSNNEVYGEDEKLSMWRKKRWAVGVRCQSIKCASVSGRMSADPSSRLTLAQQCENLPALTVTETKREAELAWQRRRKHPNFLHVNRADEWKKRQEGQQRGQCSRRLECCETGAGSNRQVFVTMGTMSLWFSCHSWALPVWHRRTRHHLHWPLAPMWPSNSPHWNRHTHTHTFSPGSHVCCTKDFQI